MATLYIHIGTHKTGTSTIQITMNNNVREHISNKELYPLPTTPELISLMSVEKEDKTLVTDLILNYNKIVADGLRMGVQKYIISFEGLSGQPDIGYANSELIAASLKNIADNLTGIDDVKVIVYLRRQDDFIESMYNQMIKQGNSYTFDEYITRYDEKSFNWDMLLKSYAKYFKKENIIVRRYDKTHLPNSKSITEDFYSILGIKNFKQDMPDSNKGLSLEAMQIARVVNAHLPTQAHKNVLRQLLQNTSNKEVFEKYSLFDTKEAREEFLQKYLESNNSVAKEYLNEQALFDNDIDQYKYGQNKPLDCETVLVTMMKIAIQQNAQFSNILAALNKIK